MKRRSEPNDRPTIQKTEHIALPEGKLKLRVVLLVAAIAVAIASFAYGVNAWVSTDAGVQEITALSGEMNASTDFTFYYNLGFGGADATDERREVRTLYSEAATDALELFSSNVESEEHVNLWYINQHPNEVITVERRAVLSSVSPRRERYAISLSRTALRDNIMPSSIRSNDQEAAQYDPRLNAAQKEFFASVAAFASDAETVGIELLGERQVRLNVSDEYMSFAQENAVTAFIDLTWMKNAFIADYIAEKLIDAGYTHGALISDDGFMRCMDAETGTEYSFTFSHRDGTTINNLATLHFSGEVSIAYLHDYPLESGNSGGYYLYSDGTLRSAFLDPADGLDRSCVPELAAYSVGGSCAELALKLAGVFIAETLDMDALETLEKDGVAVYYAKDGVLRSTAED